MQIRYSAFCDAGNCRQENQDAVLLREGERWGLFVIADGMGGHQNGGIASKVITDSYEQWARTHEKTLGQIPVPILIQMTKEVLQEANIKIRNATNPGELCGSTAVVLLIAGDGYLLLSAGDSRGYEICRKGLKTVLKQLTMDETDPASGRLFNAVGVGKEQTCNIITGEIGVTKRFLLCSDGVYKYCSERELTGVVRKGTDADLPLMSKRIKDLVYQNGAGDNLSAIIVSVRR